MIRGLVQEILVRLKDRGQAERGCLAGVGADLPYHLRRLHRASAVLVIDACPMHCAFKCVNARTRRPINQLDLSAYDFLKPFSRVSRPIQFERTWGELIQPALYNFAPPSPLSSTGASS